MRAEEGRTHRGGRDTGSPPASRPCACLYHTGAPSHSPCLLRTTGLSTQAWEPPMCSHAITAPQEGTPAAMCSVISGRDPRASLSAQALSQQEGAPPGMTAASTSDLHFPSCPGCAILLQQPEQPKAAELSTAELDPGSPHLPPFLHLRYQNIQVLKSIV